MLRCGNIGGSMKNRLLNVAAAAVLVASSLAAVSAHAEVFQFSYTFADGKVVSGVAEGPALGPPGVLFDSIVSLVIFGQTVPGPIIPSMEESDGKPPGGVTVDGSLMDLLLNVNQLPVVFEVESASGRGDVTANFGGMSEGETFVPARWSITGSVPEPATWSLMLAGFGALSGLMYARRGRAARAAA
jgi:PEP-CTERM motif